MRAPSRFRAETPAALPSCLATTHPLAQSPQGTQRPCACHPLPRSSGERAAPLEHARDEQEQEGGLLRLSSTLVARAHARAVGHAGKVAEPNAEDDDAMDEE